MHTTKLLMRLLEETGYDTQTFKVDIDQDNSSEDTPTLTVDVVVHATFAHDSDGDLMLDKMNVDMPLTDDTGKTLSKEERKKAWDAATIAGHEFTEWNPTVSDRGDDEYDAQKDREEIAKDK